MGHPRRMLLHNRAYLVTNRLAEGLPFVANCYINLVLYGILARACARVPSIAVCAWVFLANHYHAVLVTRGDPQDLQMFMNYVDGELAKIVKRLLGKRTNCKIWAQRYHPLLLLTPQDVIKRLVYVFTNPVRAGLVARVRHWLGVTTFTPTLEDTATSYRWFRPSRLRALANAPFTPILIKKLVVSLQDILAPEHTLSVQPCAWLDCFDPSQCPTREEAVATVLDEIRQREEEHAVKRKQNRVKLPHAAELECQNPHKSYVPTKQGRRKFCVSADRALGSYMVSLYRDFCRKCQHAWQEWLGGNFLCSYPPGAFLPPHRPLANIVAEVI